MYVSNRQNGFPLPFVSADSHEGSGVCKVALDNGAGLRRSNGRTAARVVLGLDPGATVGWCYYDAETNTIYRWGAESYLGFPSLASILSAAPAMGFVAAIEEPFVRAGSGPAAWAVGECCKVFGYLRGRIEASGIQVTPVEAGRWQAWLTGRARGTKGMGSLVQEALKARIELPRRSNGHARDALGVALYAAEVRNDT